MIELLGSFWEGILKGAQDNESMNIIRAEDSKIRAKTELQESQLKNDTYAIVEAVSAMKASQLYKVAEDLYRGKAIAEIRNLHVVRKSTAIMLMTFIESVGLLNSKITE